MKLCYRYCSIVLLSLVLSPAWAALTPTQQFAAEPERAQLQVRSEARAQLTRKMVELGVARDSAIERVGQLTDPEVLALQDRIDELPAGAGVSTTNLLLIVIILILLL